MSAPDSSSPLRQRIREAARDRCGYCLSAQRYVMAKLEIEHITPRALGGTEDESNLWLFCVAPLSELKPGHPETGVRAQCLFLPFAFCSFDGVYPERSRRAQDRLLTFDFSRVASAGVLL